MCVCLGVRERGLYESVCVTVELDERMRKREKDVCVCERGLYSSVCKYVSGSRNQKVGTRKRERETEKREGIRR